LLKSAEPFAREMDWQMWTKIVSTHSLFSAMPQNFHELRINIQDACESGGMQMLSSVRNETKYRFDMCWITIGAHIDIRWVSKLWEFLWLTLE